VLVAWLARFAVLRNKKKTFELEYENYAKQKVLHGRGVKRQNRNRPQRNTSCMECKVYSRSDLFVGFQFANILYRNETGALMVDNI